MLTATVSAEDGGNVISLAESHEHDGSVCSSVLWLAPSAGPSLPPSLGGALVHFAPLSAKIHFLLCTHRCSECFRVFKGPRGLITGSLAREPPP